MSEPQATSDPLMTVKSLRALQEYVNQTGIERGFGSETSQDSFMLIVEELGEVAKAMRPLHGVKVAEDSSLSELSHEIADVQLLLLSLANKLGIDVWDAVVAKEAKNRTRTWT